jgi:hypothetical protein
MACDTRLKNGQTISERADEVRRSVTALDALLKKKKVRPVVGPNGQIAFAGWPDGERDGVTDACAYRRIMATGSALARAEIAQAERIAGRSVDRRAIVGSHSHDGGSTWHDGKG